MRFRTLILALSFLFLPLVAGAANPGYVEGTDYRTINPPLAMYIPKGKVQVLELFWYGCPHCYDLDPELKAWIDTKPAWVEFVRMPAVFNRIQPDGSPNPWYVHAKAFYAAETLGVGGKIHKPFFEAIHRENRPLRTEDDLAKFFAEHGVSEKEFRNAFNSFAVDAKVAKAMDITKESAINGVPAIIVDGKYQVLGSRAASPADYLKIADFLIAKEHGSR